MIWTAPCVDAILSSILHRDARRGEEYVLYLLGSLYTPRMIDVRGRDDGYFV